MTRNEDLEIAKSDWPVVGLCHPPRGAVWGLRGSVRLPCSASETHEEALTGGRRAG